MNTTIHRIIAAVDYSEPSLNALATAGSLAKKCGAKLYILHAYDNILESIGKSSLVTSGVSNKVSDILSAISNEIAREFNIETIPVEQHSQANEAILKTAFKYQGDLIVMGTYGESGFRKAHLGTTAYSTIKYATCPVLLIPPGKRRMDFRRILYPIRPIATAFRHYEFVKQFMKENSVVDILGLYSPDEKDSLYDLNDLVLKLEPKMNVDKISYNLVLSNATPIPQTVLTEADEKQSDLIVVTPATDPTTNPFYIGPRTYHITRDAKIPLLIINKTNKVSAENAKSSL